ARGTALPRLRRRRRGHADVAPARVLHPARAAPRRDPGLRRVAHQGGPAAARPRRRIGAAAPRRPRTRAVVGARRDPRDRRRGRRAARAGRGIRAMTPAPTIRRIATRGIRVPLRRPWGPDVRDLSLVEVVVEDSDGATGHGFSWTPSIG